MRIDELVPTVWVGLLRTQAGWQPGDPISPDHAILNQDGRRVMFRVDLVRYCGGLAIPPLSIALRGEWPGEFNHVGVYHRQSDSLPFLVIPLRPHCEALCLQPGQTASLGLYPIRYQSPN